MINVRKLSRLALSLATLVLAGACDDLSTLPSGPYTLSGVVTQMTASGSVPVRGVFVEETTLHRQAYTDESGRYKLAGLPAGPATIQASLLRFESASRSVTVSGDTTVDVELLQREQFTLSGFVTEDTPAGRVPVSGVSVDAIVCPPQRPGAPTRESTETDINGFYSISGMCGGPTVLSAWKSGYELPPASDKPCGNEGEWCRWVTIAGPTRFDVQLGRK